MNKGLVEYLDEYMLNPDPQYAIMINGEWGSGKSFVLDMFEEKLEEIQSEETCTDKYFIIRYNSWKYDYYDEPLIAIVSAIISEIEEKTKLFPLSLAESKWVLKLTK